MNVRMWQHPATRGEHGDPRARAACRWSAPTKAPMACNEYGPGRLAEPPAILAAIDALLAPAPARSPGKHALVTSGPTHEPIDPVRYIANRSSGRQGHAIAAALAALGARVTLVSGPVDRARPRRRAPCARVETAQQMLAACQAALPADIAVCAAAVADWRVASAATRQDQESRPARRRPRSSWCPTPTSWPPLAAPGPRPPAPGRRLRRGNRRRCAPTPPPSARARAATGSSPTTSRPRPASWAARRTRCTWSPPTGIEDWPRLPKAEVAHRLAARIAAALA